MSSDLKAIYDELELMPTQGPELDSQLLLVRAQLAVAERLDRIARVLERVAPENGHAIQTWELRY